MHEPLEERLCEPRLGCLLARHDGPKLVVVADHDQLLGTHDNGDQRLRLRGLRRLVHHNFAERNARDATVASGDAGTADDVRLLKDLLLQRIHKLAVLLLVTLAQVASLFLQLDEAA